METPHKMHLSHDNWLMSELPKAEQLFQALSESDEEYGLVLRSLTAMYGELNARLGRQATEMGYPFRQWEWKDSGPLTALEKALPELAVTRWHQMQLSAVLTPSDHPWVQLISSRKETTSLDDDPLDMPILLCLLVSNVQREYISIHDDVFRSSLARVVPVFGERMQFDVLYQKLHGLLNGLTDIQSRSASLQLTEVLPPAEEEALNILDDYIVALALAIGVLCRMCGRLHLKCEGQARYSWREYRTDMATYEEAVREYQVVGIELNRVFDGLKVSGNVAVPDRDFDAVSVDEPGPAPHSHERTRDTLLKHLFVFRGRTDRLTLGVLFPLTLGICALSLNTFFTLYHSVPDRDLIEWTAAGLFWVGVVMTWVLFCLAVRRLHDMGKPGWPAVFLLSPVGPFMFFLLAFRKGTEGANEYGPSPVVGTPEVRFQPDIPPQGSADDNRDPDVRLRPETSGSPRHPATKWRPWLAVALVGAIFVAWEWIESTTIPAGVGVLLLIVLWLSSLFRPIGDKGSGELSELTRSLRDLRRRAEQGEEVSREEWAELGHRMKEEVGEAEWERMARRVRESESSDT